MRMTGYSERGDEQKGSQQAAAVAGLAHGSSSSEEESLRVLGLIYGAIRPPTEASRLADWGAVRAVTDVESCLP